MSTGEEQSENDRDPHSNQVLHEELLQNAIPFVNDNVETKRTGDTPGNNRSRDTITSEISSPQPSSKGSMNTSVSPSSEKPSKVACLLPDRGPEIGMSLNALVNTVVRHKYKEIQAVETMNDDDKGFLNERIVNELLHDTTGTFPETLVSRNTTSGKLTEIQAQIKSTMEKAFWDGVVERLEWNPPDYTRVIGLVKEVRDELDALVPQSWKQELHESIDVELFSQVMESGVQAVETMNDDDKGFLNERIVNELLHDTTGTFPETLVSRNTTSGKLTEIQAQIKSTMEKAFWDGVVERLEWNPPDYTRVIGLAKEVRDELDALVPQSWKQELHESIDVELFSQVMESGVQDVEYLAKLLDYALSLVLSLGAPARDSETKAAHEKLLQELSGIVTGMNQKSNLSFASALVKGLRFILEQIQVLKQDISISRIRTKAALIQGPAAMKYMQKLFTDHYGPSSTATSMLPRTVKWLSEVQECIEKERDDFNELVEVFKCSQSNVQSAQMAAEFQTEFEWTSMGTMIRLGLLQMASRSVAANEDNTPETLKLNVVRLRDIQNEFQRIIVLATGLLLVRQTLAEKEVPAAEIDDVLKIANKQLNDILSDPLITSHQIGELLAQLCSSAIKEDQSDVDGQFMTRVLSRSLSAGDSVFARVAAAVRSSVRAVLLLGQGCDSCLLAEMALKRIGASSLMDLVVGVVNSLEVMASVTCQVHGPWYMHILRTA